MRHWPLTFQSQIWFVGWNNITYMVLLIFLTNIAFLTILMEKCNFMRNCTWFNVLSCDCMTSYTHNFYVTVLHSLSDFQCTKDHPSMMICCRDIAKSMFFGLLVTLTLIFLISVLISTKIVPKRPNLLRILFD